MDIQQNPTKKLVLAGGTGYIGRYLAHEFAQRGWQVWVITRDAGQVNGYPSVEWSDEEGLRKALEGADLLVNLAGKSVNCRYHARNRAAILNSRLETTQALGRAIQALQIPPKLWVNSSTATIYRHAEDRPMTEFMGELGEGFSVEIAKAWEQAFFDFRLPRTRQVALRTAIVLGDGGGALGPYKNLVRFGMGGRQGSGEQMFSWIHLDDLRDILFFLLAHPELEGAINAAAPNPVRNKELMATLRRQMGHSCGLRLRKWMLRLGAWLSGTETELVLKSRWVLPERLEKVGYRFRYARLEDAIAASLGRPLPERQGEEWATERAAS